MLKEYLKEKNISMYGLAKSCDIPYSTLNDLANGKVDVMNCKLGMVKKLAAKLSLSIEEFCDIAGPDFTPKEKPEIDYTVSVKNKNFLVRFTYEGVEHEIKLGQINNDSKRFINSFAEWSIEDAIKESEWRKMNAVLFNEKE